MGYRSSSGFSSNTSCMGSVPEANDAEISRAVPKVDAQEVHKLRHPLADLRRVGERWRVVCSARAPVNGEHVYILRGEVSWNNTKQDKSGSRTEAP